MDYIELSSHAPFRPLDATGQVHNLRVWLIELDAQVFKDCLPEPGNVGGRAFHQLLKGGQAMMVHETLEATAL